MANYTHLSSLNVQGAVETSTQGKLIGSFDTMPAATALNSGQIVLYTGPTDTYVQGKYYVSNGTSWVLSAASPATTTVDSALSDTSTNPVQNKVIKEALDAKVADIESALAGKQGTITAGTGISKSGNTISLATSGVTAGSAGSATSIPTLTVDSYGRVTSLGSTTIYPPTTVGTSGQYWRSDESGAGAWTTPATSPSSGSTTLITAGGVYSAISTKQKQITISSSDPTSSDGSNGDLWATYE